MQNKKCSAEEAKAFIELIQQLSEEQQVGMLQMLQGAKVFHYGKNKKQRITRCSRP